MTVIKRHFADLPGFKTEQRVTITSHFSSKMVYVSRLVQATKRFGKRRYLINCAKIRTEQYEA